MIRFPCPVCGKTLKVPEDKDGKSVRCPQCHEVSPVRAQASVRPDEAHGPAAHHAPTGDPPEAPGPFAGMSPGLRWLTTAVAAAGVLSLLLVILRPFVPGAAGGWMIHAGLLGLGGSIILLFVLVSGHATNCPSCGRWWARTKGATEFVEREVFDRGTASVARSRYRTTYACCHCGRTWSVTETEEYPVDRSRHAV